MPIAAAAGADAVARLDLRPWRSALGSRTTTPGTPPSRTIRFEPTPTGMHRHRGIERGEEGGEIVDVRRLEPAIRPGRRCGTR